MHEYIIADRLLQTLLEESNKQGLTKVNLISLELGELIGLDNESLRTAFEILSRGSKAEGCKLRIKRVGGSVSCEKCGYVGGINSDKLEHVIDPAFGCPKCGSVVKIDKGNELEIKKIA